jgi:hypothetical protein
MIIPDEAVLTAKTSILKSIHEGTLPQEEGLLKLLEIDPHDSVGWRALGILCKDQGRLHDAGDCFWRAAEVNPCRFEPFMCLGTMTSPPDPLAAGLLCLAGQKALMNEERLDEFDRELGESQKVNRKTWQMAIAAGAILRGTEPQAVTDRLRPHRLLQELIAPPSSGLARHVVDQILEYRASCTPLLFGILRGWVQGDLPEDYMFPVTASLALLGEMRDPVALPALLEFIDDGDMDIREAASWAVARIAAERPDELLPPLRQQAASGAPSFRWGMAHVYSWMPDIEGVGDALVELLQPLEELPPDARDVMFRTVVGALFDTQGQQARALVLALIARYSRLLESDTPRDCLARNDDQPPIELTVYDFCCEPFEEEEEEEEEAELVAPVRPKLGRNDPCWCGSGKKYKKCHLASDEGAGAELDAGEALADFAAQEIRPAEMRTALKIFLGPQASDLDEPDEGEQMSFLEWLIHDYTIPRWGRTPAQEFLRIAQLTGEQRQQVEGFVAAVYSLLEVQEVRRGTGVRVRDLLQSGEVFVYDVSSSKGLSQWDCLLSRVVNLGGRHEFAFRAVPVPRSVSGPLREWVLADRQEKGGDWPSYLRANSHRLRQQLMSLYCKGPDSLQLSTFHGEPLVFSKAVFEIRDRAAFRRGVKGCAALHANKSGGFDWLESESGTVLGSVRFAGNRLVLECSSRERLVRGCALLESLAPGALKHLGDEFTDWRQAVKESKSKPARSKGDRLPPHVEREIVAEFYEQHFGRWPDMPLPALGGRTPRDAVRTAEGRCQVLELVKTMENDAEQERRAGRYAHDFSRLKAELGIDSL